ncbi:MAG: DUF2891 family protein, partial [Bacteroidota bacterium]
MKYFQLLFLSLLLYTCTEPASAPQETPVISSPTMTYPTPTLKLEEANRLADLPLACIQHEYPNKLGQTVGSAQDLQEPHQLHPAFYGCFDWHSAVHGHWSLVALLRVYPDLEKAAEARRMLAENLSATNIAAEVDYFNGKHNKSY